MRLFADVASGVEDPYFAHAVALAVRARGATAPNPLVGCVIVRGGRIVGEGFHARAGEPHAEVNALADAGVDARGAELYVTLEPCAHTGRTPPCTAAIIEAGIVRVHIGMRDPSPEARGGADVLVPAGVEVVFAPDPAPFAAVNEGWLKRLATRLPLVTVKAAVSLDGRPAFADGQRASMSGVAGAEVTRRCRAQADAVLVGAATVTADDPALTVRDREGRLAKHQPLRVVLVRGHVPAPDALVFTDQAAPTLVLAAEDSPQPALDLLPEHVQIARYERERGLRGALEVLAEAGIGEVLVEAGPRLLTTLWEERLIDALVTVTAGGMGGAGAPVLFGGRADREDDGLVHVFAPTESGIVGDVSVVLWVSADEG